MATNRTPTGIKTVRCKATEGAQQCVSATHGKMQNHRFGKPGETEQWNADGTQKTHDPAADTEQLARDQFTEFTPDPALAAEARRLVAEEQARLAPEGHHSGPLPNENSATGATLVTDPAEAQREEQRQDRDIQRRAEIAAAVTQDDVRDMEAIRASHPDIITANGPRPVSVSGAPGSRLADVTALVSTWTLLGFPPELQDELTQIQLAKQTLDEMLEDILRTRQLSDPRLVSALVDTTDHIARARGLVRGTGA